MRISDWSSDVCSSDLPAHQLDVLRRVPCPANARGDHGMIPSNDNNGGEERRTLWIVLLLNAAIAAGFFVRSEEHTSELQSLMRISYAVFCLKKNNTIQNQTCSYYMTIKHEPTI